MRKSEHAKHMRHRPRLLRYLLLAAVVTMLGTTGTLAKYSSQFGTSLSARTAAFAGGGTLDFDLSLENMAPGDTRTVQFTVQNYDGERNCEVTCRLPLPCWGKKKRETARKAVSLRAPWIKRLPRAAESCRWPAVKRAVESSIRMSFPSSGPKRKPMKITAMRSIWSQ